MFSIITSRGTSPTSEMDFSFPLLLLSLSRSLSLSPFLLLFPCPTVATQVPLSTDCLVEYLDTYGIEFEHTVFESYVIACETCFLSVC